MTSNDPYYNSAFKVMVWFGNICSLYKLLFQTARL